MEMFGKLPKQFYDLYDDTKKYISKNRQTYFYKLGGVILFMCIVNLFVFGCCAGLSVWYFIETGFIWEDVFGVSFMTIVAVIFTNVLLSYVYLLMCILAHTPLGSAKKQKQHHYEILHE